MDEVRELFDKAVGTDASGAWKAVIRLVNGFFAFVISARACWTPPLSYTSQSPIGIAAKRQ